MIEEYDEWIMLVAIPFTTAGNDLRNKLQLTNHVHNAVAPQDVSWRREQLRETDPDAQRDPQPITL